MELAMKSVLGRLLAKSTTCCCSLSANSTKPSAEPVWFKRAGFLRFRQCDEVRFVDVLALLTDGHIWVPSAGAMVAASPPAWCGTQMVCL